MSTTAPAPDEDSGSILQVVFGGGPVAKGRARLTKRDIAYTPAREKALGYQAVAATHGRPRLTRTVRVWLDVEPWILEAWVESKRLAARYGDHSKLKIIVEPIDDPSSRQILSANREGRDHD